MSSDCKGHVVLFKSVSETENGDDDLYTNQFQSAQYQVTLVPVLDFEFVNLNEFLFKLKNPDYYEGIIFTSPRCVSAVEFSIRGENETSVLEKWQKHKHFVVGEKTAQMLEKFKLIASGKEAGNAKNLAEIISKDQYNKPFLYPKGSLTKDNFKLSLEKNHIKVDESLVYKTKPHSNLERNIENIKRLFYEETVYFVYFSPSGVNFTLPLLQKHYFDLNQIKFIAIGPTTEVALKESGLSVTATASKPDPKSLLDALLVHKSS